MLFTSLLKNKVFLYLGSRYLTYFIQFVTSIVIAAELGPYYMGIWGFILLVLQYFQQFHLGIANSFNVLYVHHRDSQKECNNYIGNSLALICYLSLLVIGFYLVNAIIGIPWIEKFHANKYMIWVCMIAILQYFVQFFINLFRVKNLFNRVTFCQSFVVFLCFACVFFFEEEELIQWLVASYVVGNTICVLLALTSGAIPSFNKCSITKKYQTEILKKGMYLFLYNSCFYLIIISIRTIISGYYKVEEFGMFTFSFSLAQAVLLLLEALQFIIFPKIIGKLSSKDNNEVTSTISLLRKSYITSAHCLIYLAIVFFPLVIWLMPKYEGAITSMNLTALAILMGVNTFGYLEYLIANNKEKTAAAISSFALVLNGMISFLLVLVIKVSFSFVIVATMITYFVFTYLVLSKAKILLNEKRSRVITELMPFRLMLPYIVALCLSILQIENLIYVPLCVFCLCNYRYLLGIHGIVKSIITNPEIINLK